MDDKKKPDPQQSQREGPAAYAPHEDEPTAPEGLQRPRKGPYDKDLGRNERATQVPQDPGPVRK